MMLPYQGQHPVHPILLIGYIFLPLGIFIQGSLVGRLVKRIGEARTVAIGFTFATVGYIILSVSHSVPMLLFSIAVSSLGGMLRPSLTSLVSRQSGPKEQGRMVGAIQGLNSMASIIGPMIAGFIIDHGWLTYWGLLMASISVCGLALIRKELAKASPVAQTA